MYCSNCGNNIDDNSKYCNNCGCQITDNKGTEEITKQNEENRSLLMKKIRENMLMIVFWTFLLLCAFFLPFFISGEDENETSNSGQRVVTYVVENGIYVEDTDDEVDAFIPAYEPGEENLYDRESSKTPSIDYTKIRESIWNSGMVQIGENYYYIGDKLSEWIKNDLVILNNSTAYDECVVLGMGDEPICRLYINDNNSLMLEEAVVESVWFGILYDSSIKQSNAERVLQDPPPIVGAGGIGIGTDYTDVKDKLGDVLLEESSENTIVSAIYDSETNSYFLYIDRITGEVCGIAYGERKYW